MIKYLLPLFLIVFVSPAYAWNFGEFEKGDVFVYDVCDYITIDPKTASTHECGVVTLSVIGSTATGMDDVVIVGVSRSENDVIQQSDVMLVDSAKTLHFFHNTYLSQSLQNTLFWMKNTAKITSLEPEMGKALHSGSKLFDDVYIGDFQKNGDDTKYKIIFDGNISGYMWIRDDMTLPLEGEVSYGLQKARQFSFELNLFSNFMDVSGKTQTLQK